MNISLENPEKVSGVLTLVVEEADFAGDVEKQLKDYRKKANGTTRFDQASGWRTGKG